jgi:hypothetical protein
VKGMQCADTSPPGLPFQENIRRRLSVRAGGHPGAEKEKRMAEREDRGGIAGISTGGIIVIVGIVLMLVWSFWIGLIIVLVGLIAFGGFARGRWY